MNLDQTFKTKIFLTGSNLIFDRYESVCVRACVFLKERERDRDIVCVGVGLYERERKRKSGG